MAINKNLNIGVKRMHKQNDWLGFDAVEVIPKSLKDSVNNGDYGKIAQAKIDTINNLLKTDGSKIDETIDNDKLKKQINDLSALRDNEKSKLEATKKGKYANNPNQIKFAHEQEIQADSLDFVIQGMLKEQKLRDAVEIKISTAQNDDTLKLWNELKNLGRTIEQKKIINDSIQRVTEEMKKSETDAKAQAQADAEAKKAQEETQRKINELKDKASKTTDPKERELLLKQASELMGGVAEQTGLPKGFLYLGIGVAIVVGIYVVRRAFK